MGCTTRIPSNALATFCPVGRKTAPRVPSSSLVGKSDRLHRPCDPFCLDQGPLPALRMKGLVGRGSANVYVLSEATYCETNGRSFLNQPSSGIVSPNSCSSSTKLYV